MKLKSPGLLIEHRRNLFATWNIFCWIRLSYQCKIRLFDRSLAQTLNCEKIVCRIHKFA
jgi:hypothetical protein